MLGELNHCNPISGWSNLALGTQLVLSKGVWEGREEGEGGGQSRHPKGRVRGGLPWRGLHYQGASPPGDALAWAPPTREHPGGAGAPRCHQARSGWAWVPLLCACHVSEPSGPWGLRSYILT